MKKAARMAVKVNMKDRLNASNEDEYVALIGKAI